MKTFKFINLDRWIHTKRNNPLEKPKTNKKSIWRKLQTINHRRWQIFQKRQELSNKASCRKFTKWSSER